MHEKVNLNCMLVSGNNTDLDRDSQEESAGLRWSTKNLSADLVQGGVITSLGFGTRGSEFHQLSLGLSPRIEIIKGCFWGCSNHVPIKLRKAVSKMYACQAKISHFIYNGKKII